MLSQDCQFQKSHIEVNTSHNISPYIYISKTLQWYDKYLCVINSAGCIYEKIENGEDDD